MTSEKQSNPPMDQRDFLRLIENMPHDKAIQEIDNRILKIKSSRRILLLSMTILFVILLSIFLTVKPFRSISSMDFGLDAVFPILIPLYGVLIGFTILINSNKKIEDLYIERQIIITKGKYSQVGDPASSPLADKVLPNKSEESYFDQLVKINLENLSEYYKLTKISTSNSFYASLYSGLIGFAILVTGIILSFVSDKVNVGIITLVSGVIIEFIAGIFFILYFKSVEKLKDYHDSLIKVQNVLLSFKMMEDIKDDSERVKMASQVLTLLHNTKS